MASNPKASPGETRESCPRDTVAIEIELIGDDDSPIEDAAYEITTPGGKTHAGKTLPDGSGRLDGLPEGECQISFYKLDQESWTYLESIDLQTEPEADSEGGDEKVSSTAKPIPEQHEASIGDCISSIADLYGFSPDLVWNDEGNSDLKELREDPNILLEGDVIALPAVRKAENTQATGKRHRYRRLGVPATLRLRLVDGAMEPHRGLGYLLEMTRKNGEPVPSIKGETNSDGLLEEPIPTDVISGVLLMNVDGQLQEKKLALGQLAPVSELIGIQRRLKNLGFYYSEPTGQADEEFAAALEDFQLDYGLPLTGEADEATREFLERLHLA